jgi:DeoR/GlpR family transcriptional regulator of sugar metabolism
LKIILDYLKSHGECLDADLATGLKRPLETVREQLADLAAKGEVILCRTTRYTDDKPVEGLLCRVAGYIPPASPGRKAKGSTPDKS